MIDKIKKYIKTQKELKEIINVEELKNLYEEYNCFMEGCLSNTNIDSIRNIFINKDMLCIEDSCFEYDIPLAYVENPSKYIKEHLTKNKINSINDTFKSQIFHHLEQAARLRKHLNKFQELIK